MEEIKLLSREGKLHRLIQIGEREYYFRSAEDWMPLRIICEKAENGDIGDYKAIDPVGGPMICVGETISGKEIVEISHKVPYGYIIKFKED